MRYEDVHLGMKVVPHNKTAGMANFEVSRVLKKAKELNQPFLYVTKQINDGGKHNFALYYGNRPGGGDIFNCADFEPYRALPPKCGFYTTTGFCLDALQTFIAPEGPSEICVKCCRHCSTTCDNICPIS